MWKVDAHEFMDLFMRGALFRGRPKWFHSPLCGIWVQEEPGGSSKHHTRVLFWSILCHWGSGPPEIDYKLPFHKEEMGAQYKLTCFLKALGVVLSWSKTKASVICIQQDTWPHASPCTSHLLLPVISLQRLSIQLQHIPLTKCWHGHCNGIYGTGETNILELMQRKWDCRQFWLSKYLL